MKKLLMTALIIAMVFSLVSCGGGGSNAKKEPTNMLEALEVETNSRMTSYTDNIFVTVYRDGDQIIRAISSLTPEMYAKLSTVDVFGETLDDAAKEVLKAIEIVKIEDLAPGIPAQEELDKEIGKKGQALLDAGYLPNGYSITPEATIFIMDQGDYSYNVEFEEKLGSVAEGSDYETLIRDLTVKGITFEDVSFSATDVEL